MQLDRLHQHHTVGQRHSIDAVCTHGSLREQLRSTFDEKTDKASSQQYFHYYGQLAQQQNMLQDLVRTGTYQRAMLENHADFKDAVVLDVGAGTGILSHFALQAGARKVWWLNPCWVVYLCRSFFRVMPWIGDLYIYIYIYCY